MLIFFHRLKSDYTIFYICQLEFLQIIMKQLALTILLILTNYWVNSQTNDTINLDELIISSSPNALEFKQVSRTVHIITKDEILNSPAFSIDDILKVHGGVDIRSRGAMGVQSDIYLRGGTFDQGLIMIDGISVNDPQTGHHNLNQAVDLDEVEKIEIFEGPGSRWFGPNSFSGGINIIRSKPKDRNLSVSLNGGSYGYLKAGVRADYGNGKLMNKTSVGYTQSDGYKRNTDFNVFSFDHNSVIDLKQSRLSLNFSMLDKGFGANSFYTSKYPDQYEHIRNYFSVVSYETGKKFKIKTSAWWRRNLDRFELFRESNNWYQKEGNYYIMEGDTAGFPTSSGLYPYQGHNFHRTDIIGANGSLNFNTIAGSTSLSLNIVSESIVSNVLGETMTDTIWISGSDGYYNKSKQRTNAAFSVNQHYRVNRFSISAGLSINYNNDFGIDISPGIDLGLYITENVKLFASANKAVSLPTFTDLYYQGPTNISNPDLVPEQSISTEAGVKYFDGSFNASISGFYRNGKDIIDWVKFDADEKWQSENLSTLNTYGISFSTNKRFSSTFLKNVGVKYTWLTSTKDNGEIISLYALDYLNHNINMFISHNVIKDLKASWTATYQKRNGSYIDYESGLETPYSQVLLLNLKLLYKIQNFEVSISGSNLLNNKYYDIGNIEQPGLWIIGGVKVNVFGNE